MNLRRKFQNYFYDHFYLTHDYYGKIMIWAAFASRPFLNCNEGLSVNENKNC